MLRCRPLLGRVPRAGSPASSLLLRHSDFSPSRIRSALRLAPPFRFPGDDEISQVPGRPFDARLGPETPVGAAHLDPGALPLRCGETLVLAASLAASSPYNIALFRGLPPWLVSLLSTLRSRPRGRTTQDSLSSGGPLPTGTGLPPAGRFERFQFATSFLLSQALPGATGFRLRERCLVRPEARSLKPEAHSAAGLRACRVAPGGFPPGAPTDPDVRISRIRLLRAWIRYVACRYWWTMRGSGSGSRSRIAFILAHVT
jgi:hypothetical protein